MKPRSALLAILMPLASFFASQGAQASTSSCTTVAIVGDSITHMSRDEIAKSVRNRGMTPWTHGWSGRRATVDNFNRNDARIPSALEQIALVRAEHGEPSCWVIAVGSNDHKSRDAKIAPGTFGPRMVFGDTWWRNAGTIIDAMVAAAGETPLWMVNIANHQNPWIAGEYTRHLTHSAQSHGYQVIDWASYVDSRPDVLYDGLHPDFGGQWMFGELIGRAIAS